MKVRTTTSRTVVTADGYVTHATTTITTIDGAVPGGAAQDAATGKDGDARAQGCFDAAVCDEAERRLIAAMRAYLRPTCAPAPLMERLHACLDRAEDEECRGCGR